MENLQMLLALEELKESLQDYMTDLFRQKFEKAEENRWLKTKDVCELINCSAATVGRLREDGLLKYSCLHHTYYHLKSDVFEMMESGRY